MLRQTFRQRPATRPARHIQSRLVEQPLPPPCSYGLTFGMTFGIAFGMANIMGRCGIAGELRTVLVPSPNPVLERGRRFAGGAAGRVAPPATLVNVW